SVTPTSAGALIAVPSPPHAVSDVDARGLTITPASAPPLSHARHVPPEVFQALRTAEQRGEDRRVGEQDIAAAVTSRRHPDARVDVPIPGGRERMRPGEVDRLRRQDMDGLRVLGRLRVVRQMEMEVEDRHTIQQAQRVEIPVYAQGRDLISPLDDGGPE